MGPFVESRLISRLGPLERAAEFLGRGKGDQSNMHCLAKAMGLLTSSKMRRATDGLEWAKRESSDTLPTAWNGPSIAQSETLPIAWNGPRISSRDAAERSKWAQHWSLEALSDVSNGPNIDPQQPIDSLERAQRSPRRCCR
jgi:hypothetical protein